MSMKPWSEKSQHALLQLRDFYIARKDNPKLELKKCPLCLSVKAYAYMCDNCPWTIMTNEVCFIPDNFLCGFSPCDLREGIYTASTESSFNAAVDVRIRQLDLWIKYYKETT